MSEAKLNVKLLRFTPDPEELITVAGKLCYSSAELENLIEKQTPEDVERFIKMLIDIGHGSALEHSSFSFGVEGVSRALTHQLVRHRIGCSYSQKSQRYVKEGQFEYVVPNEIKNFSPAYDVFIDAMKSDQIYYDTIVEKLLAKYAHEYMKKNVPSEIYSLRIYEATSIFTKETIDSFKSLDKEAYKAAEKKAIENARAVLPNACETKIIVTMNARSLMHFFEERCCARAQDEIRALANAMLKECKKIAPTLFKNAGAKCVKNGMCPEGEMSCGMFPTVEEVREKYNMMNNILLQDE